MASRFRCRFEQHGLPQNWVAFLEDFRHHWPTGDDHNYPDFVRNGVCGDAPARKLRSRPEASRTNFVHKILDLLFRTESTTLQSFFETRSSFSAHRSVPYSRETGRTYDVPGH